MTDHAQDAPLTDPGCLGVSANTMCCAVLYRDGSSGGANHRAIMAPMENRVRFQGNQTGDWPQ